MNGTLWAIHVPGPDDVYAMASKEEAEATAEQHNAAMAEYFARDGEPKPLPAIDKYRPPRESLLARVIEWPYSAEGHAKALAHWKDLTGAA